jgi:hypothetical protein
MNSAYVLRWAASWAIGMIALLALARPASAYPWMIRYDYGSCASCHADPSGAGPLTARGRDRSGLLTLGKEPRGDAPCDAEPPVAPGSGLLWGLVTPVHELRLGGDVRTTFSTVRTGDGPIDREIELPQADLAGDVKIGPLRAAASIGYAGTGSLRASLSRGSSENLVSRYHWIGYELDPAGKWLLRAGRIPVPFGIRTQEHALWVRSATRTTIDEDQQDGVALFASGGFWRGEVMAILGNYQLGPDDYRERGYSAYGEVALGSRMAVGASSLLTRARRDIYYRVTDYRQAQGLFFRAAPATPLVILAEGDWIYQSLTYNGHRGGYAGLLQADLEAKPGVHLVLTGEAMNEGRIDERPSYGMAGGAWWFFAPHADVRIDAGYRRLGYSGGAVDNVAWAVTFHVYL